MQAMEIINFNRRGGSPLVKVVTTAIPFLNARAQGTDVIRRTATGDYSAKMSTMTDLQKNEIVNKIRVKFALRGAALASLTGIYYLLMHDTDEYKEEREQIRDDYWLIPTPEGFPTGRLPIPFEIGVLFKVVPERLMDLTFGETTSADLSKSYLRSVTQTFKVDPLGWQISKPLIEAYRNKSSFTGNAIVPEWMEKGLEEQYQITSQT